AARRQELTRLHSHIGRQATLAVAHLSALQLEFALRDADAAVLSAVEIQRHRHAHGEVVVGAEGLLPTQLQHWIRAQTSLPKPADRRIDVGACGAEIGIVGQRPGDELFDADVRSMLSARDARSEDHHTNGEQERSVAPSHGQRTATETFVEPFPVGPSQVTVTWRVPRSENSIVPAYRPVLSGVNRAPAIIGAIPGIAMLVFNETFPASTGC